MKRSMFWLFRPCETAALFRWHWVHAGPCLRGALPASATVLTPSKAAP